MDRKLHHFHHGILLVSQVLSDSKAIYFTEGPRGSSQISGYQSVTTSVNTQWEYT